jgi:hypothetical protein
MWASSSDLPIQGTDSEEGDVMQRMAAKTLAIATAFVALASSAVADEQTKRDAFAAVGVIDAADLDEFRGREGGQHVTVATDQELTASVIGGSITAHEVTTGGVTFGEGALDGFGGIGVFNVVTGNNNSVQAAIGVTFNLLE